MRLSRCRPDHDFETPRVMAAHTRNLAALLLGTSNLYACMQDVTLKLCSGCFVLCRAKDMGPVDVVTKSREPHVRPLKGILC